MCYYVSSLSIAALAVAVVSDQLPSENILSASSDLVVHSSEPSLPTDEAEPKRDALEKGHPSEKTSMWFAC